MKRMNDDLKAYLDGELSPDRHDSIEAELKKDAHLRGELDHLRGLTERVRGLAVQRDPIGMEDALKRLSWRVERPRVSTKRRFAYAVAGSAAVALLAVVFFPVFAQARLPLVLKSRDVGETVEQNASEPNKKGLVAESSVRRQGYANDGADSSNEELSTPEQKSVTPGSLRGRDIAGMPPYVLNNRRIVRSAELSVKVQKASRALAEATRVAIGLGGYVESSAAGIDEESASNASATILVPQARFDVAMNRLRSLGEVTSESMSGEDVTTTYVDSASRVKVLRDEFEQYRLLLKSARRIGEILSIKSRMTDVRQQIESLESQRRTLASQSDMSTISVSFTKRQQTSKDSSGNETAWLDNSWATATKWLKGAGRVLMQAAIYAFVFSPIWLTGLAVAAWLKRRS